MFDTGSKSAYWGSQDVENEDFPEAPSLDLQISKADWNRTYRRARSIVHNPADAEDVAQEAYLRLFEASTRGRKIDCCVAWMGTVVRRVVVDQFRRARPDLHSALDDKSTDGMILAEQLIDSTISVEQRLSADSLIRRALQVLARLPEKEKQCVLMFARGYTFTQIANALGWPYSKALKTTKRALTRTRLAMG